MFVRTASDRDLEAVKALLVETWHATYDAIYGAEGVREISGRWHSVVWLKQLLRRPRSEFIVADTGTELAGMAYAAIKENESDVVEVEELDVRPSMQGKGIGRLLLGELEDSFWGCRLMRLEVEEKNSRALDFYRANGFVELHRRAATRWVDATIVTLEKRLK
ncbi:GCN5 family acetyltransferase [Mesorhizobium sp. Root157]|uniref:GNAT family N-acetyltransferase n=1 Tax=Mesorhizobium sp. Root157 TaxID=1736477 RepID=UPI0006FBE416|nr:GNAT family N-acetyltransferase [Mesorhizobium sp. Root157]KQZ78225.1 GCN5 family acetyltransferase [Mesorhizobium sp. Root157]